MRKLIDLIASLSEGEVVKHPSRSVADDLKSSSQFATDPNPTQVIFQRGDCLTYKSVLGRVVRTSDNAVELDLPQGKKIIQRDDPNLEIAPYGDWDFSL